MASKKGKKNKGTTVSLQAFNAQLEDGNAPNSGQNVVYTTKKPSFSNWAEEMDEEELITEKERILLPSAPRASRGPNIDDSQIPRHPPFTVHLSNVSYDIGDEDVYDFFRDMKIVSVRIPKDMGNRPKGYGYVDFENREDLIEALAMSDQQLKGRSVRISLGESNRRDGGSGRGGGSFADATPNDWRSDMKPNSPPRQGAGGGFSDFRRGNDFAGGSSRGGDFDRNRERGFGGNEMTRDQMMGGRRGGGFNDFPADRGDRDQLPPRDRSGSNGMDSSWRNERATPREEPNFYRGSYAGGGGGGGGGRPPMDFGGMRVRDEPPRGQDNRGYNDRGPMRQPSPPRGGHDDERGRRGYASATGSRTSRENSPPSYRSTAAPPQPVQPNEPQRERKKLVLAPRTVKAQIAEPAPETSSAIFGGAKPVDTAAREKEIEEKLQSMELRTTNRVRSDSQMDEPRIRILQRTPEERDRRDRDLKYEKERRLRERIPSTSSDKSRELLLPRHSIPEESPPRLLSMRSPPTAPPSVASSFCSESFHPSNKPPTSKLIQRSDEDDDCEIEGSSKPPVGRNELVQNEINDPLKNPWNRRKDIREEDVQRRPVYETDRKTPDFDRNSEKEKDTNSDPEDDRDAHHRFINEDNVAKDDDDDFMPVSSRSRPRRDRDTDKGFSREEGNRGERRGGGNRGNFAGSGGGGYGGGRPVDPSRRGDRGDSGPRRPPSGRVGGDSGGGSGRRGGYGGGGPPR